MTNCQSTQGKDMNFSKIDLISKLLKNKNPLWICNHAAIYMKILSQCGNNFMKNCLKNVANGQ